MAQLLQLEHAGAAAANFNNVENFENIPALAKYLQISKIPNFPTLI